MAKGKKKNCKKQSQPTNKDKILLATAILNLIKIIYDLIKDILN